jgi:hypothetical protein
VTLRARWVTLRARWVTLRARWVTLRARWVTLRASRCCCRGYPPYLSRLPIRRHTRPHCSPLSLLLSAGRTTRGGSTSWPRGGSCSRHEARAARAHSAGGAALHHAPSPVGQSVQLGVLARPLTLPSSHGQLVEPATSRCRNEPPTLLTALCSALPTVFEAGRHGCSGGGCVNHSALS